MSFVFKNKGIKMKKLVKIALVMLFFLTGIAVGMKELPELEPYDPEAIPTLPSDVKKIIAQKALRVILDEVEDNPLMFIEKQWRGPKSIMEAIYSFGWSQEKALLIDTVILLIQNGANPNTKNYKGNTILHLLISTLCTAVLTPLEAKAKTIEEANSIHDRIQQLESITNIALPGSWSPIVEFYIKRDDQLDAIADIVQPRIEFLLVKYGLNINAKNNDGDTIAHHIVQCIVQSKPIDSDHTWFISQNRGHLFVAMLYGNGLDFKTIKNNNGKTACEILNSVNFTYPYIVIYEYELWPFICPSAFEKYPR
jgi:hypothetical protein